MDSSFEGAALDPSKCSEMSVDQKRRLIYELSKQPHVASEVLRSWSRQEILQILCAEMGKERKYTGLTKLKIIEALLKIVSCKKSYNPETITEAPSHRNFKRPRKTENPSGLTMPMNDASRNSVSMNDLGDNGTILCKNSACRATLREKDAFCKRCSCCICCLFDDNKDPSLWLTCSPEPPFLGDSCGRSFHLECALKHEKSVIGKEKRNAALDGSFYCVSCGKENGLLGCWRKQLMVAKDTRRIDILCYRLSLSQKLLKDTKKYQKVSEIVGEAVKMLETEVGPLTCSPVKMGRGIVNRLQSGPDVQKLCSVALESLENLLTDTALQNDSVTAGSITVRFEDVHATSVTVILGSCKPSPANIVHYRLWHRKVTDRDYPVGSTCTLFSPNIRYVVRGLNPTTEYCFKVATFSGIRELCMSEVSIFTRSNDDEVSNCLVMEPSQSPTTNFSSLSNPSSVEDESNIITPSSSHQIIDPAAYCDGTQKIVSGNLSNYTSTLNEEHCVKIIGSEPNSDALELEKNTSTKNQIVVEKIPDNGSDTPAQNDIMGNTISEAGLPITPCRVDSTRSSRARTCRMKSINKDKPENIAKKDEHLANRVLDTDLEHSVRVIRQLECSGHIDKKFRQKFLTWYSLRATQQEVRVVKVFIDAFTDDPQALAEQLVDTFSEHVSNKLSAAADVPAGLCMKLWH